MNLILYNDASVFLKDYEEILLKEEVSNQLILKNAYYYSKGIPSKNNIFGCVIENNKPILIFLNANPFNLLLYSLKNEVYAFDILAQYIIKNDIIINGVNAYYDDAIMFINIYKKYTDQTFECTLEMDIMQLNKLIKPKLKKGTFELATLNDLDIILDYFIKFNEEAVGENIAFEVMKEKTVAKINNQLQYLFRNEEGKIVAIANVSSFLKNGVCVSGVYTNVEYRGQGYCSTLMYYLCKKYLDLGYKFITLFVDKTNPISNRVYMKIGFEIVKNNYDFRINK